MKRHQPSQQRVSSHASLRARKRSFLLLERLEDRALLDGAPYDAPDTSVDQFDPDSLANYGSGEFAPDPGVGQDPNNPYAPGANVNVGLNGNEPTITVNPLNSNNIIVAQYNNGLQTMKISTDGGSTFPIQTNATLPAGQSRFAGDDSLAFDAQGRLFWDFLTVDTSNNVNVYSEQVNPATGAQVAAPVQVSGGNLDKEWLAADHNASSPFANNLYTVWTDFNQSGAPIRFARSVDHGASWQTMAGNVSGPGEGFTWPPEVSTSPNGDVYVAWHGNTVGNGTNGEVIMRRSTNGGVSFGPELFPFPAGTADINLNAGAAEYGSAVPRINGLKAWLQGSVQPRILVDPVRPGNLYVVDVNGPDHAYTSNGDPSDVVISRSTDFGATWTRSTVSHGPSGTFQIMPAAAIDPSGNISVTWYDNRGGAKNASGDFLLDVYTNTSYDGGLTFSPNDTRINGLPFDPDLGAPDRFSPNQVLRIGEYNGLASQGGSAFAVWTGNTGSGQQIVFNKFAVNFSVLSSTPAQGQLVTTPPNDYVIKFTGPVDPATVAPGDLNVNGVAAVSDVINGAGDTVTFHYNATPVTTEGLQSMAIAAGAIGSLGGDTPVSAFSATFRYDPVPLTVTTTNPPAGSIATLPLTSLVVNFNEPIDPTTANTTDLVVSQGAVTGVSVQPGNQSVIYSLSGVTNEGTFQASIASGALTDVQGNPNQAFAETFTLDLGTIPYPSPLAPVPPLGSLIYDPALSSVILFGGDTDHITLPVNPGQTITVLVTPTAAGLQPSVQLLSPSSGVIGGATAAAPGKAALVQTVATPVGGTYTIDVTGSGGTVGGYTVQVYLNAAVEAASVGIGSDSTRASAQDLSASFVSLQTALASADRGAVVGTVGTQSVTLNAVDSGWWDNTGFHGSGNKNYFAGSFPPNQYNDYFVFNLAGLSQPVTGARLNLSNPAGGYSSTQATDDYTLFDVSTAIPALESSGSGQTLIFNDLGSGTSYGSTTVSSASNGQVVSVPMNASALAALNANLGNQFAVGGDLITQNGANTQFLFAGTGTAADSKQLVLSYGTTGYYSFTLAAGQKATLALKALSPGVETFAVQDAAGNVLANGIPGATNLDRRINNFVAPAAGTYYVAVGGTGGAKYSLVVTRDAVFDTDPNGTFATAQDLAGTRGSLGFVSSAPGPVTTVVPSALANTETFNGNAFPFNLSQFGIPSMRYQQIYSGSQFAQSGFLNALHFRRASNQNDFTSSPIDVQIRLSYAATTVATASAVYSANVGSGAVTVYDGLLTLTSNGAFTNPQPFDIAINVSPLFFYNPSVGDLLLDITVRNSPGTNFFLATPGLGQSTATTRIYSTNATDTQGVVGFTSTNSTPYGLITAFDVQPPARDDWYTLNVTAGQPQVQAETSTPGDGPGLFGNTLSPHIELYDPSGNLVFSGVVGPDGRNETLKYLTAAPGAYRVHVTSKNGTSGEYFLGTTTLATPSPTLLVDNRNFGFHAYGPGWGLVKAGYGGDSLSHAGGGTGANYGEWRYAGNFTAGTSYQFFVTWAPGAANASNASYKILDGGTVLNAGIPENQRVSPNSALYGGTYWQSIYIYTPVTTGYHLIRIQLGDNANGNVNADAIFDPPLGAAAVAPASASSVHAVTGPSPASPASDRPAPVALVSAPGATFSTVALPSPSPQQAASVASGSAEFPRKSSVGARATPVPSRFRAQARSRTGVSRYNPQTLTGVLRESDDA